MLGLATTIAILLVASPDGVAAAEPAPQARGLVIVLSPGSQDEVTRNAMARILGELGAAPFRVVTQPVDPTVELMHQVETAGRDLAPVAAFAIVREPSERPGSVAVWVSNRITNTTTVQRVEVRGGNVDGAAAHLAVEAVELVRASMAGLWPRPPRAANETEAIERAPAPPAAPSGARLALGVGVGLLQDLGDTPAFWAPALTVSYGRPAEVGLRFDFIGFGPGANVSAGDGSGARLQRTAAWLSLARTFRPDRTVRPTVSAGAGVQYLGAQGTGAAADLEHDRSAWSAMAGAGGGLLLALTPYLALAAEAKVLLSWPTVVVRVGSTDAARFDRPAVFANVGLLATF